ncbi:hypothetical protein FSARC_795 [Fusarium sarcochroum]|uniref:Uncharacterized protein n=1 Tax=Fusarium sarcochroum TaxID=1208366 RepID=A0A8H4XFT6_9HYPO|nr:hypothetical protein FSARC_795 [Fusarium sarcochroum]
MNSTNAYSNVSNPGTRPSSPPPTERPAGDNGAFNTNFQFSSAKGSGPAPAPADDPIAQEIDAEWKKGAQLKHRMKHDMPKMK